MRRKQIRAEHRVDPKSIDEVEVRVHPALFGVCNIQEPKTGLEGKFSLRATTAMALLGEDTSNLETFTDAKVTEARVVSLRDRIRIVRDEKTPSTRATVVVKSNGRIFEIESDSGQPASDLLAQREKYDAQIHGADRSDSRPPGCRCAGSCGPQCRSTRFRFKADRSNAGLIG